MKATEAFKMADDVVNKKVAPLGPKSELVLVLEGIEYAAKNGSFIRQFNQDEITEESTLKDLKKLGYETQYRQPRPTARPYWIVTWEKRGKKS